MTVINITMRQGRALVASDTLCFDGDGRPSYSRNGVMTTSKIFALPHARCVAVVGGTYAVILELLAQQSEIRDFDSGVEALQSSVLGRMGEALTGPEHQNRLFPRSTLFLVGWSERRGNVVCSMFETCTNFRDHIHSQFEAQTEGGAACLVVPRTLPGSWAPHDAATVFESMLGQINRAKEDDPDAVYMGGDCTLAEITKDTITIRNLGPLGHLPDQAGSQSTEPGAPVFAMLLTSVVPTASQQQSGSSTVFLTETTLASADIRCVGGKLYISATVDADGGYSARTATLRLKVDGVTVAEKEVTSAPDTTAIGNPWYCRGAMLQVTLPSTTPGLRTVTLTAVGSHATYGVTIANGNLYAEEQRPNLGL